MNPERLQQIDGIFQSAIDLPPERRREFLDQACANDPALRSEVESLITSLEQSGDFIEGSASDVAASLLEGESLRGRQVAQFLVGELLGRGGMGDVYSATDKMGRRVALKVLAPRLVQDRQHVVRFLQEARAVLALNHPNIVTVYDIGEADGVYYIASELIEGETLRTMLARGIPGLAQSVEIAIQFCTALAAAHDKGIVHRDIKPENVMLRSDGYVKVLDFGIAKLTEQFGELDRPDAAQGVALSTVAGLVMGTTPYMAPEQARGARVDARTDVWSCGVLLYELLSGQEPFSGGGTADVLARILEREPAPLASLVDGLPAELQRIVTRALRKKPEDRYPAMAEMLADLKSLRQELEFGEKFKRLQSLPTGAVFLSYASQDAEAAARIGEALRAAGVEVWLDRSELRGGDAWDSQIKKQIHDCALFLPIISAHTNARTEGYFRREWKLATRRLLDIADDAAFLVPVVIDDTREADARVPEEFLGVQWTWLPGGETTPAYAQRVRQLVGLDPVLLPMAKAAARGAIEPSAQSPGSAQPSATLLVRRFRLPLIVLLLGALALAAVWFAGPSFKSSNIESVAVLPFANATGDPEFEYLSDGVTESLINALGQLPGLSVKARSMVFRYKGKDADPKEVASTLSVEAVVNGRLERRGDRLMLSVALANGSDGDHLWGERYDSTMTDLVEVQSGMARDIAQRLHKRLSGADEQVVTQAFTSSGEAYQLYLRGRYHVQKVALPEVQKGIQYLEQATAIDPSYALAYVGLADAYRTASAADIEASQVVPKAKLAAEKAVQIDGNIASAHAQLGILAIWYDWDTLAAERHFKRALELDPDSAEAHMYYAHLRSNQGRHEEALREAERALELEPFNSRYSALTGQFLVHAGREDDAIARLQTIIALDPNHLLARMFIATAYIEKEMYAEAIAESRIAVDKTRRRISHALGILGYALAKSGDVVQARAVLDEMVTASRSRYVSPYSVALVYNALGEPDETFAWLERGFQARDHKMNLLKVDPKWNNLHDDPRFADLVRRIGF